MSDTDWFSDARHVSRSWPASGTPMEDACPCPQEPCGHVRWDRIDPDCPQHSLRAGKTLRSSHTPADCPARAVSAGSDGEDR